MTSFIKYLTAMIVFFISFAAGNKVLYAADKLVFDSTDHYLGACSLTNKSEWTLKDPIDVTTFEVWYSWNQGETELPVKVLKDGQPFAEFTATRGNCDPYQHQWCNADYKINKLFPKGTYTTEIPTSRQCLKPGGTGAIRLYSADETPKKAEVIQPAVTTAEEQSKSVSVTPDVTPPQPVTSQITPDTTNPKAESQEVPCGCDTKQIAITAAGTSFAISLLVSLILKRK